MGAFFVDSLLFVLWMIVFARPPFLLFSGVLISIRDCVTRFLIIYSYFILLLLLIIILKFITIINTHILSHFKYNT